MRQVASEVGVIFVLLIANGVFVMAKISVVSRRKLVCVVSPTDWTGIIETELFAQTYKSYGLATVC
jgi:hypothetical protein